jgi:hypothetical protein
MAATKSVRVSPPTSKDLDVARKAWDSGTSAYTVASGTTFYRVLKAASPSEALLYARECYPSAGNNRFSPVRLDGSIVPAAYAASTREHALWEAVLRNIRHKSVKIVPQHETDNRYLTEVRTTRELRLLNICKPYDQNLVAGRKHAPALTALPPAGYSTTREWAQQPYLRIPEMDGIFYESHQLLGTCLLVYSVKDLMVFETVGSALNVRDEPIRTLLRSEAAKSGAVIDFGLVPSIPADEF